MHHLRVRTRGLATTAVDGSDGRKFRALHLHTTVRRSNAGIHDHRRRADDRPRPGSGIHRRGTGHAAGLAPAAALIGAVILCRRQDAVDPRAGGHVEVTPAQTRRDRRHQRLALMAALDTNVLVCGSWSKTTGGSRPAAARPSGRKTYGWSRRRRSRSPWRSSWKWAARFKLPGFDKTDVVMNPNRAWRRHPKVVVRIGGRARDGHSPLSSARLRLISSDCLHVALAQCAGERPLVDLRQGGGQGGRGQARCGRADGASGLRQG